MRKSCLLFCVLALLMLLMSCAAPQTETQITPATTQPQVYTTRQWIPVYNDHACGVMAQWADRECASTKELTNDEILSALPGKRLENATYSGHADFKKDGSVLRLRLRVYKDDLEVYIAMGSNTEFFACCISRDPKAVECSCGELKYEIYEQDTIVFAETVWNEIPMLISVRAKLVPIEEDGAERTEREDIEKYKPLFEEVLECFSWYGSGEPDFLAITPNKT